MIESMKEIDAYLYIIGDGKLRAKLEQKISKLGLKNKVYLLGRQLNPYKYISKADCFLFTSDYEGFPNVLLEALACGLPIISTDCPSGPREILAPYRENEYGVLVPVNDKDALICSMKEMMTNHNLREKYREKAQKRADDFDKGRIVKKFITVMEKD